MKLRITIHGVAYEVDVEVLDAGDGFPMPSATRPRASRQPSVGTAPAPAPKSAPAAPGGQGSVASPIAGIVVEIKCKIGDVVNTGDVVLIIEAMKMKTSIAAPTSGKVKAIPVAVGDNVRENQILIEFE